MRNVVLLLSLPVGPFVVLAPFGLAEPLRGRIGIACVFLFTGLGHFLQAKPMSAMVPQWFSERSRLRIIYASGVFELVAALGVLIRAWCSIAGILLCAFLMLVLPANIDAAVRRVPFGGHQMGPVYLLVRVPLQILLIAWTYWFAVRHP